LRQAASSLPQRTKGSPVEGALPFSFALGSSQEIATHIELFEETCRASVELFGCDHSGLVLFNRDWTKGLVVAEYPARIGARGTEIPMSGVPFEESLTKSFEPRLIKNIESEDDLGPVKDILKRFGITALLVIPIVVDRKIVGSFSLDRVKTGRQLNELQLKRADLLARSLASTLEKSRLVSELRGMQEAGLALISIRDQAELLRTIVDCAVRFIRVPDSGIYELSPQGDILTLVSASPSLSLLLGKTLKLGHGLAGRLVESERNFAQVPDYRTWPDRSPIFDKLGLFESVAERRLVWQGSTLGVLFVNDRVGRVYTETERQSLDLLADYAAVALQNSRQARGEARRTNRLKTLAETSTILMEHVSTDSRDQLLDLLVNYAAKIFEAESSSVWLVDDTGQSIRLEASVGHSKGKFEKGLVRPIAAAKRGGLTSFIAATDSLFNLKGDELRTHFAVERTGSHYTASGQFEALLAFPLRRRVDGGLLGLIKIENRVDAKGRVLVNEGFSEEDDLLASVFAGLAAAAVEESDSLRSARGAAEQATRTLGEHVDSRTVFRRAFHHIKHLILGAQLAAASVFDWADGVSRFPRAQRAQLEKAKNTLRVSSETITAYLNLIGSNAEGKAASVDVNAVIKQTLTIFQYTLEEAGIAPKLEGLSDGLPPVHADPLDLVEVFYSLISNAAYAMKNSVTKELSFTTKMTPDGNWVAILIADTGCGISREFQKKIFSFGFTTRPPGEGHGLGLYGVQETVSVRFSGRVALLSSRVGHGTTFQILLKPDAER
jgi:signal transduction histidine kinase